jgi:TonB family protein
MTEHDIPVPAIAGSSAAPDVEALRLLLPESRTNLRALLGGGSVSWSLLVAGLVLLMWMRPDRLAVPDAFEPIDLVYVVDTRSGGGGGGGNKSPDPPRTVATPAAAAVEPDPVPVVTLEPEPPEPLVTVETPAIAPSSMQVGLPTTSNTDTLSRGPGSGVGAGPGNGSDIGPGPGPGSGPGRKGGPGGDGEQPRSGPGIINPTLVSSARPAYTAEAMVRRIEGVVVLNCVVSRSASVDDCEVVHSLDPVFGLDEEARKAARRFRFLPGRNKQGEPVPVLVRIEIAFNMR